MTRLRALIFDMDGTIVDNMRFHEEVWLELLAENGITITTEEFHRAAAGKINSAILRQYLGERLTEMQVAEYAERKEALYRELFQPHLKALDGFDDFLAKARTAELKLALATSAPQVNIDFVLAGIGAKDKFDAIVSGDEITHGKPDPEIFLTAAQRLGVPPEECLVFEDAPAGIEAARRAGMASVVIATTMTTQDVENLPHVLRLVQDFTELDPAELEGGFTSHPRLSASPFSEAERG